MADEPKPWEQFKGAAKPWEQFAAPSAKPWEQFSKPARETSQAPEAAPTEPGSFDFMGWLKKYVGEGTGQIADDYRANREALNQGPALRLPGQAGTGLGAVRGAFNIATSPVNAAISAFLSKPAEAGMKAITPEGYPYLKREDFELALSATGARGGVPKLPPAPALTGLKKLLSPQSVSPIAGEAAKSITAATGEAARSKAVTAAELESYHQAVNSLPEPERLRFIDDVENGRPTHPQLQPLADALHTAAKEREDKLKALPSTSGMSFVDDYLAHFWQDPQAAQKIEQAHGGAGKQGSAASLKKRTVPTYADGIAAGLKPLTTNPIEITLRYINSMDNFIAATTILDTAKANGAIKYIRPKTMGASGHPDSFKVPDGWEPLKGRGSTDKNGAQAYAPADWARVYNNWISRGFHGESEDWGNAIDAFQRGSNAITGLELGLSGYHAANIATSAIVSDLGRAISNFAGGKPGQGLTALGQQLTAPVSMYMRGRKWQQIYLKRTPGTPDLRKVVDIATKGGIRGVGKGHAPDYQFSTMGSYWTAFKRGALKQEMAQSLQNIKNRPVAGTAKEVFKLVGRAMETISDPLFNEYIPTVKNAAVYDLLRDWLEANPNATHEQQVGMATRIAREMDNRFGEVVQDNIFTNKMLKQVSQIVMRSWSWTFGLARQLGTAVKNPASISISSPKYNPSAAGVIASAIAIPTINMIYQKLKTGKDPETIQDAFAPRTGGEVPGFGGRGTVEERAMLPSHERDIFGWYFDPMQEAKNKQSRMLQMIEEGISRTDYAGRPYMDPDAAFEQQLGQWLGHVAQGLVPISLQSLGTGHKTGSTLGLPASMLGIREASKPLEDPEGTERGMKRIRELQYRRGQKSIRKQQSQYGGPQE